MATSPRREVDQLGPGGRRHGPSRLPPRPWASPPRPWPPAPRPRPPAPQHGRATGFLTGSPRLAGSRGLSFDTGPER